MSQTDPRAVAKAEEIVSHLEGTEGFTECVNIIAHALADAERRGLERAAKMMCSYCNDPQWPRSAIVQGNAVHIGPITGSLFPCNAMQIHSALRAQAQELQDERDKIASMRNSFPVDAASWRGVDEHDVCAECGGAGTKLYGNTSTYHYSAGGQAMTLSVCDKCWGSGNKQKPWRSWKQIDQLVKERDAAVQEAGRLRGVLEKIAKPALGGKQQQWMAQEALIAPAQP